ncbi:MAG: metallophosphoesterase N-terminal domain-containing protein [Geminicoccaceae bacterium]
MANRRFRRAALSGVAAIALGAALTAPAALGKDTSYKGTVETIAGDGADTSETVTGVVFNDANRDGSRQDDEAGLEGVMVSNGKEVVQTGSDGVYELPAYEDMTVFVTKPAGYDVPVDEDNIPQFHYNHKPAGSPPPISATMSA